MDVSNLTTVLDDGGIQVFNETDDPAHLNNLFDHFEYISGDPPTQRVHFTSSQSGVVQVLFHCKCPVHIDTSEEYQTTENPAFIISIDWTPETTLFDFDDEWMFKIKDRKAFRGRRPVWYTGSVTVLSFSSLKRLSLNMAEAINDIFQFGGPSQGWATQVIKSEATGWHYPVISFTGMTEMDRVGAGVYIMASTFSIRALDWKGQIEEVPLAEEVRVRTGSMEKGFWEKTYTGSAYKELEGGY